MSDQMRYEGADLLAKLLWGDRRVLRVPGFYNGTNRGFRVGSVYRHGPHDEGAFCPDYGEGDSWEAAFRGADVDPCLIEVYARKYPSVEPGDEVAIPIGIRSRQAAAGQKEG